MKRVVCIWLPNWPITRLTLTSPDCAAPDKPVAIVSQRGGKQRILTVNRTAYERGVMLDQRLTDAKAIAPDLVAIREEREADAAGLVALSRWAQRFTPSTAIDAPGGIWLDITGCARLWRGERRLVEALTEQLSARRIPCRVAVADTFGAAWAFARNTGRYDIVPPGAHRDLLLGLPLSALRLSPDTLAGLRRLGLKTIGDAARLPRAQIAGRFEDLLHRFDQAMGDVPEAIAFEHPPSPWFERAAFAEFISTPEDLQRAIDRLAGKLCRRLAEAGRGGKSFVARFFGADGSIQSIAIATSLASRDARSIGKLLAARLDTIDPGFGIEVVTLRASRIEPVAERQMALDERGADLANIAPLIDRLGNRLGFDNVWRFAPRQSHWPERSVAKVAPLAEPQGQVWPKGWARPIRLLSRPEPIEVTAAVPDYPPRQFRWRRVTRRIQRAEGPERIAPEWWREAGRSEPKEPRDYYRVEDESGARYWVFREGRYSEDGRPRWYIHGLLA